jgi:hypothetical protein
MHRSIVVSGVPGAVAEIAQRLDGSSDVISLAVHRGASLHPKGDVLVIDILNRGADGLLHTLRDPVARQEIVVAIKPTSTLIDRVRRLDIFRDAEDVVWEEVESDLRGQGRLSVNYMMLMSLGAAIAAAGFAFGGPVMKGTAFIGASIVAPAFEPVTKLSLGLVLRRWQSAWQGLLAVLAGYLALVVVSAATWGLLRLLTPGSHPLPLDHEVSDLLARGPQSWIISLAAATAGAIIVTSLRETVIIGPVIALVVVPATALVGVAVAAGQYAVAAAAALRAAIDVVAIIGCCAAIFWLKRRQRRGRHLVN